MSRLTFIRAHDTTINSHEIVYKRTEGGKMFFTLGIALIVLSVVFHEFAHWYEMSRYGVEVEEVGIGIPLGKHLRLSFTLKRFPGITFTLNPLLLGAYVKPSEKGARTIESLPYRDAAQIFGAGPLANIIFAGVFLVATGLLTPNVDYTHPANLLLWGIYLAVALVCFFARRWISAVMPIFGLALLAFVVYAVSNKPSDMAGPIGIVRMAKEEGASFLRTLHFAAFMSANIGLFNMLPVFPFDGGRTTDALLKKLWPGARPLFQSLGLIIVFLLIGLTCAVDVGKLAR